MPRRNANENVDCKVYIGNLGEHPPLKEDLQYEFSYYGPLVDVWIARSPPGFAYIEFENPDDAHAACEGLDGKLFEGRKLRVEMARHTGPSGGGRRRRSRSRSRSRGRGDRRGGRRSGGRRRSRSRSRSYSDESDYSDDSRSRSRSNSRSDSRDRKDRRSDRRRDDRSRSRDRRR